MRLSSHSRQLQLLSLMLTIAVLIPSGVQAYRRWEFVQPRDLSLRIVPETLQIRAGETATFTIHVRNRSDKTVKIPFTTGQRWDAAVFHHQTQIWRWSQGYFWEEARHEIPIKPGETEISPPMSWKSVDRNNLPLPQGSYKLRGFMMTTPRFLVSNDVNIELLPPVNKPMETIRIALGKHFSVKLPRFIDNVEVKWSVRYDYNDYRIHLREQLQDEKESTLIFRPTRAGHVVMHLFAKQLRKSWTEAVERRTIRVEVMGEGWIPVEE